MSDTKNLSPYERDVYRCYRKVSNRSGCSGRSTYPLEKIEKDVLAAVHQYFANIRSIPTAQMLASARQRSKSINEMALAHAEDALQKAQAEMAALEEEAVKALTGESKLDISFINGLIPKRKVALERATEEVSRLRGLVADNDRGSASVDQEIKLLLSWADAFDVVSTEVKRSIISALIDRITVYRISCGETDTSATSPPPIRKRLLIRKRSPSPRWTFRFRRGMPRWHS